MTADKSNGADSAANEGDSIKVFVRIRPSDGGDIGHHQSVAVDDTGRAVIVKTKPESKVFTFDQVINVNAQQESVFSVVGKKLIDSCINGYNGTIFAYGQTGSGKTFTMLGPSEDADNFQHDMRGVIPRSFEYMFGLVAKEQELHGKGKEFLMKCTFIEIYHEQVYDLLDPSTMSLPLRESMKKGVYVDGLAEKVVDSASEAYKVLNEGWINRRVASTSMNRESSRSHAVFTIVIESKEQKSGVQNVKASHLNLVDLAGSERQKDTNAIGQRLKEAGSINRSLSVLGNCIMSLVDIARGKSRHIPYRDSKLTFLLRDSLGGNAKTHIIACVHPDSRYFGETLSTLQFARNAKMIKNKAIVNEDTQGNITSLQAEIRRLKETVQQLQSAVPSLDPNVVQSKCPQSGDAGSSVWKDRFINAMMLRDNSELDKKSLQEQISKLEELCNKKEKFLQSTKMIIKFRETRISKLEKTVKSNGGNEDTDARVVDLNAEVSNLKEMLEHHPAITKYAMEIQRLKSEIRKYRTCGTTLQNVMADNQRVEEFLRLYRELMVEANNEDPERVLNTPSHTPQSGDNISVATVEKYKSQIAKLETQVNTLTQTLTEERETAEKKEMELNSEVTSLKNTVAELKTVLDAQQLKSKVERDIHLQTVKTITTPKKVAYKLRNRHILTASSTSSTPSLDDSIGFEADHDNIMMEEQPDFMAEQAHEAIMEEMKQLQSSNNSLNQRIEEYETDAIKLKQHISKIDHQNAQLNEILQRERTERAAKGEKADLELSDLRSQLEQTRLNMTYYEGEAQDLKVLLASSDKELKDLKAKQRLDDEELQKTIGVWEARAMQMEMELSKMDINYQSVCEERDTLLQGIENAEETVRFNEALVDDLNQQLHKEKLKLEETENQLESVSKSLAIEKQNHEQLFCQTKLEGAAQEKEILQLAKENELLQAEAEVTRTKLEQNEKTIHNLKGSTEAAHTIVTTLRRQQEENQEAVAGYMSKIEELKMNLTMSENKLLDQTQQCQTLQRNVEELAEEIDKQKAENGDLHRKLQTEADSHNVEASMMREDMDHLTDEYSRIQEELKSVHKELDSKQKLLDTNTDESNDLKMKLEEQKLSFEKKIKDMEERAQNAEMRLLHKEDQAELLAENDTLKKSNIELQYALDEYENQRKQKNEEIDHLKATASEAERHKNELHILHEQFNKLKSQMECDHSMQEERMEKKEQEFEDLRCKLSQAFDDFQTCDNERRSAEEAKIHLKSRLDTAEEEVKSAVNNSLQLQVDVDRLKNVGKKYHEENEDLKEQVHNLREEGRQCYMKIEAMNTKIDKLTEENAKLAGHQNHKQKIQYTYSLKEENRSLREQLLKAQREKQEWLMEQSIAKHHASVEKRKENVPPMSSLDVNRVRKTTRSPRMFLSGDYT